MAKTKKTHSVQIDAEVFFRYAESFNQAVELLAPQFKRIGQPLTDGIVEPKTQFHVSIVADAVPFATADAFALELYMKCLYAMDHSECIRGHDVKQIYRGLKANTKRRLRNNYNAEVSKTRLLSTMDARNRKTMTSFTSYLNLSRRMFEEIRYLFERAAIKKSRLAYWPLLRFAARKSVLDIMPEWA
jgi:hypothetical protein